jgi:preprotein translocase subunit SecY
MPTALARILEQGKNGILPPAVIIVLLLVMAGVITMVVYFERAQRKLTIQYPKRQIGTRMFQGDSSHLPLKLNASGVIPPIFASTLLYLPATAQHFRNVIRRDEPFVIPAGQDSLSMSCSTSR